MAIVATRPFYYPDAPFDNGSNDLVTSSSIACAAAGDKVVYIFEAPVTGTITAIQVRSGAVTVSGNFDVRLETVDLTTTPNRPTGTLKATNSNATVTPSVNSTWYTATLTGSAAVTKGDLLAVVIVNSTGNVSFAATIAQNSGFPYVMNYIAGTTTWAANTSRSPVFMLNYGGTYQHTQGVQVIGASLTISTSTTPDEVGNLFTAPFGMRVIGCKIAVDNDENGEIILYDSANTVLLTVSLDKDQRVSASAMGQRVMFSGTTTLTVGAQYRLVYKPSTTTSGTLAYWSLGANAELGALPGGTEFVYTGRTDAGSWTETNTRQVMLFLYCDGVDVGGGLLTQSGMLGGIRG